MVSNTPPIDISGVPPAEEIEPSMEIADAGSPLTGPYKDSESSGCSVIGFSSKSLDLTTAKAKIIETPDYFRRNSRRFQIAPTELFSEDDAEDEQGLAAMLEASIELGVIPEVLDSSMGIDAADEKRVSSAAELEGTHGECIGCRQLKQEYELLFMEQAQVKRVLKDVEMEKEAKSRECREACASLQKLQMELMQKSMHVGSLAFAVEGQVKEKSRWFLSLGDLSRKFRLLKMEHAKLSEEAMQYRRNLADITQMTEIITSTLDRHLELEMGYKDLKLKFIEEAKERKDLYNKMVELKGNIRVFCRCRPLNTGEIDGGASVVVDFESAKDDEIVIKAPGAPKKVFKFDAVFSPEEDQGSVFEKTAPFATSVLDGYNVCIFAYGQTGTGKTFTMEGTEEARGVNYRTLEELFRVIQERQQLFRYEITASVLEVYNEQIHDLLLSGSQPGAAAKRLEVRQAAEGIHHVPGLVEARVTNMSEAWEVLQTGSKARAVGSTNANEHSSRSHCIHCVMVKGENLMNGESTRSKLWLIDLAGSERVTKTDAQGERLKEAQNINKSLSALGDVISALANKSAHIPFRNSKLTHLLQDSLGGDSKTLMFVQISPNEYDVCETLCSLNFASRVRGIELGPAKKQIDGNEISKYKQMVERTKQDIKNKDVQIKKLEETVHSLELKNKAKDLINKNLQDKVKELESQLLIERKLARQHVDTKIAENHQLQQQQLKQQEPNTLLMPLLEKNHNQVAGQATTAFKELGNIMPPPQKENKLPDLADYPLSRKADRFSLYPASQKAIVTPAPRRYSLIPMPTVKAAALPPLRMNDTENDSLPPLPSPLADTSNRDESRETNSSTRGPAKKFANILRRSLQKKVIIRSPLPQMARRGGGLNGVERARVSIGGGSGRKALRAVASDAAGKAERMRVQQKRPPQKTAVKERGWNLGTTARNIF